MPIPLLLVSALKAGLVAGGALVAVRVALLVMGDLVAWFSKRLYLRTRDQLAITVKIEKSIESGDFELVQGIFDPATGSLTDARRIRAKAVAEDVEDIHRRRAVAVWS